MLVSSIRVRLARDMSGEMCLWHSYRVGGWMRSAILRAVVAILTLWSRAAGCAQAQKPKIIVDQDARGPASTDLNAILMFAQSPQVDVLGVTLLTGDQWVKEETAHTLRALEIAGRTDIPVLMGAQ